MGMKNFSTAVRHMAASPKTIQERVGDAYLYHLCHVKTEELPEEIQTDFEDLKTRLTSEQPIGDEGSVNATIRNMTEFEALEIAQKIVYMTEIIESRLRDQ
jgi:hypothetical protein